MHEDKWYYVSDNVSPLLYAVTDSDIEDVMLKINDERVTVLLMAYRDLRQQLLNIANMQVSYEK